MKQSLMQIESISLSQMSYHVHLLLYHGRVIDRYEYDVAATQDLIVAL